MYHYIRDSRRTRHPGLNAVELSDFVEQVDTLANEFEMATLESAIEYLGGGYEPSRDLCLLTFDDGLLEHAEDVTPILSERGIEGIFGLITRSLEEGWIAPAHKNHLLLAALPIERYETAVDAALKELAPELVEREPSAEEMAGVYRWDEPRVRRLKYRLNYALPRSIREAVLERVFEEEIGPQSEVCRELYLDWRAAEQMQGEGMTLAGHSHEHQPMSSLADQREDIATCRALLRERCGDQQTWPFIYPFGKPATYDDETIRELRAAEFACSFCTDVGSSSPGADPFRIRRYDPKDIPRLVS